ncbi:MAG: radical SAM protein [Sandaracinaceae bacterium]|nr:radical SAM protein [Sandaracinaceae bacterium]
MPGAGPPHAPSDSATITTRARIHTSRARSYPARRTTGPVHASSVVAASRHARPAARGEPAEPVREPPRGVGGSAAGGEARDLRGARQEHRHGERQPGRGLSLRREPLPRLLPRLRLLLRAPDAPVLGLRRGDGLRAQDRGEGQRARAARARAGQDRCGGEALAFSGNTDCYQPLEASYELTRRCLEVCLARSQPIGIVTKGTVIRRDVELLAELNREAGVHVFLSIAFLDEGMRRAFDPFAPPIEARFETMERLAKAGIPVGVSLSPVIPGVNDSAIPGILERSAAAGATRAFLTLVRLPREVREVFDVRLEEVLPDRARKVRAPSSRCARGA